MPRHIPQLESPSKGEDSHIFNNLWETGIHMHRWWEWTRARRGGCVSMCSTGNIGLGALTWAEWAAFKRKRLSRESWEAAGAHEGLREPLTWGGVSFCLLHLHGAGRAYTRRPGPAARLPREFRTEHITWAHLSSQQRGHYGKQYRFPQKIKSRAAVQSSNSTSGCLPRENKHTNLKRYVHPRITAALPVTMQLIHQHMNGRRQDAIYTDFHLK